MSCSNCLHAPMEETLEIGYKFILVFPISKIYSVSFQINFGFGFKILKAISIENFVNIQTGPVDFLTGRCLMLFHNFFEKVHKKLRDQDT